MTTKTFIRIALAAPLIIVGCKTQHASESERFTESVASLMPFKTEKLQITAKPDYAELRFVCNGYIDAEPDCEIDDKGAARARRTTFNDPPTRQDEKTIWRNVVVSKKHKRVVCIDRYLQGGHTEGYVYVFQTETDQFPNYSPFHWDVSDSRNMEFMGAMLESLRPLAVGRLNLEAAYDVLQAHGFPGKESVGNIASIAVFLVFQHADLDHQKRFLPQMEEAVAKGRIEPTYLAMLKDRIDVREGRPQKYGTQIAADGNLAPVLDADRLNEWRSEVGLPPITTP